MVSVVTTAEAEDIITTIELVGIEQIAAGTRD